MDRFEELERLIDLYMKQYCYSRENAIRAIRSDALDVLRSTQRKALASKGVN